jgi:hypothetical protein
MTDAPLPPAQPDEAPIDAEFEPATVQDEPDTRETPVKVKRSGPGWGTAFLLGAVSLGSLGLAAFASGLVPGFAPKTAGVDDLKTQIAALQTDRDIARTERAEIGGVVEQGKGLRRYIDRTVEGVEQKIADVNGALDVLEADLNAVRVAPVAAAAPEIVAVTDAETGETVQMAADPAIIARIEALETAMTALQEVPVSTNETSIDTELVATVEALRGEIETLKAAQAARISAVTTEIEVNTNTADAALALSAIEAAARRGQPFQSAYQKLAGAMPDAPVLKRLQPLSETGAPTYADLREQFGALTADALDAEAAADTSTPGWMRTVFGDGIKVRRDGEVAAEDVINGASDALADNDIRAALTQIDRMSPAVQSVFTDWRDSAQQRQSLESALDALRLTMIAKD